MSTMKALLFTWLLILLGCGTAGEQEANRKKLLEGLKDQKVKRITEEQIHTAAYQEGQNVIEDLKDQSDDIKYWSSREGRQHLDSLTISISHGEIRLLFADTPSQELNADQRALIEAYQYSTDQGQTVRDNVQSIPGDYLLFTSPVVMEGSFIGMWSLMLSRKTLIRNF